MYVEKPLSTSIGEGRTIVEAATKHKRIVQIGTQQHSIDHYRKAVEIVQSRRLGRIADVKVWDYVNENPGFGAPPDSAPTAPPGYHGRRVSIAPNDFVQLHLSIGGSLRTKR